MERRITIKLNWDYLMIGSDCCTRFFKNDAVARSHLIEKHGLNNDQIERALRCLTTEGYKEASPGLVIQTVPKIEGWSDLELDYTEKEIIKQTLDSEENRRYRFEKKQIKKGLEKLQTNRESGSEVSYANIVSAALQIYGKRVPDGPLVTDPSGAGPSGASMDPSIFADPFETIAPSTSTAPDSGSTQSSEKRGSSRASNASSSEDEAAQTGNSEAKNPEEGPSTSQAFVRKDSLKYRNTRGRSPASNTSRDSRNPSGSRPPIPIGPKSKDPVPTEAPSTSDAPGPSGTHDSAPSEVPSTSDAPGPSGATSKPIEAVKIEHQGSPSRKRKESNDSSSSSNPSESNMGGNPNPSKNRGLGRENSGENPLENPDEPSTSETPGSSEPSSSSTNRKKTNN